MSLSRIAVGVDFSPESLRATDHAMAVARHCSASLTLVHVTPIPDPSAAARSDGWNELLRERLAAVRAALEALRARLTGQGVDVSHMVVDGYPDTAIAETARELGADLVVVGTHGKTGIQRLLLGSVAEKTCRLADASVLVARGEASPGGYRRVVAGTDYSELADRALERAFELTAPGGDVRVVNAWTPPYVQYDLDGQIFVKLREAADLEANAQRQRILDLARPAGVTVRLDVVDGPPFAVLDDLSASADLVVVGSHGRRGVRRLLLGSVAEATVRHARCSVLIAR